MVRNVVPYPLPPKLSPSCARRPSLIRTHDTLRSWHARFEQQGWGNVLCAHSTRALALLHNMSANGYKWRRQLSAKQSTRERDDTPG